MLLLLLIKVFLAVYSVVSILKINSDGELNAGESPYAQAQKCSVSEGLQCIKLVLIFRRTCSTVITGKQQPCTIVLCVLDSSISYLSYSELHIKRDGRQKMCESKLKWEWAKYIFQKKFPYIVDNFNKACKMRNDVPFTLYITLFFSKLFFEMLLIKLSDIFVDFQDFLKTKTLLSPRMFDMRLQFWPLIIFSKMQLE